MLKIFKKFGLQSPEKSTYVKRFVPEWGEGEEAKQASYKNETKQKRGRETSSGTCPPVRLLLRPRSSFSSRARPGTGLGGSAVAVSGGVLPDRRIGAVLSQGCIVGIVRIAACPAAGRGGAASRGLNSEHLPRGRDLKPLCNRMCSFVPSASSGPAAALGVLRPRRGQCPGEHKHKQTCCSPGTVS